MATVVDPKQSWNRAETDTRVRHPLHRLRSYIRTYVSLEGVSVFFLYLVVWFWIGLLLDFGVFKLFAYDWVREMPLLVGSDQFVILRVGMLIILLSGLLALVTTKVLLRLLREFSDLSLALVLERRYPEQLGDRLITAVEMADPRLSTKYGHSQALVDETIRDAANRVDRVTVRGVFNWRRLYRYGYLLAGLTIGLYLLIGVVYCIIAQESPVRFVYRSRDVAAIWAERNLLLQDSLWPRSAYLDVIHFKGSKKDANEMRIGDNAPNADVWVRAYRWVIADDSAPDGWRPLRWKDLPELLGYTPEISLPAEWDRWTVDIDDLDPQIPAYLIPESWRSKSIQYVLEDLKYPGGKVPKMMAMLNGLPVQRLGLNLGNVGLAVAAFRENAQLAGTAGGKGKKVAPAWPPGIKRTLETMGKYGAMRRSLFNWQEWTVDRIGLQLEQKVSALKTLRKAMARAGAMTVSGTVTPQGANPLASAPSLLAAQALRQRYAQAVEEVPYEKAYQQLQRVFDDLDELVEAGDLERTVRKLTLPEEVTIYTYGETTKNKKTFTRRAENKYQVVLDRLPESVKFYAQGEDYYTGEKKITLVPQPRVEKLTADRWEPAYIYYRMQGRPGDVKPQLLLKGKKQKFTGQSVYVSEEVSRVELPSGSDLTLTAESSDLLKDEVRIEPARKAAGTRAAPGKDSLSGVKARFVRENGQENRRKFWVKFTNVTRKIEFVFKFTNEDNVDGKRQIVIEPTPDKHPDVTVQMIENVFRKKRNTDYYLVTPRARVPFKGAIADDRGLNDVEWVYQVKEARAEATRGKIYTALTALQGTPVSHVQATIGPLYRAWLLQRMTRVDAGSGKTATAAQFTGKDRDEKIRGVLSQGVVLNGATLLEKFAKEIEDRSKFAEVDPARLRQGLKDKPPEYTLLKQITLKTDEDAFSFKERMPWLASPGKEDAFQTHYLVELWVTATDNNIESVDPANKKKYRPVVSESKQRFTFLVVSENDLLAEIFREEEDLRDDLEKLFKKLNDAKTKFDTQVMPNLGAENLEARDRALKGTRTNEVKKVINMVGRDIVSVHSAFTRILQELEANEVQKSSIRRVEEKICEPLREMTDKSKGDFKMAEEAAERLQLMLEKDLKGDEKQRAGAGQEAKDRIDQLISRLSSVLEAMQKIIGKDELLRDLIEQEQKQRRQFAELKAHRDYLIELLTRGAVAPETPKK